MAKPKRTSAKGKSRPVGQSAFSDAIPSDTAQTFPGVSPLDPPAKRPSLLAISVVLFSLWFVYLLVVALGG